MFELMVKIVGLNLKIGPTVYTPSTDALESGALHGVEAILVTQSLPKRRIGYKVLIDASRVYTEPNGVDCALISGEILNDSSQQISHFDATLQLLYGKWVGHAQLIYATESPHTSEYRFLEII